MDSRFISDRWLLGIQETMDNIFHIAFHAGGLFFLDRHNAGILAAEGALTSLFEDHHFPEAAFRFNSSNQFKTTSIRVTGIAGSTR